jgi:alkylation response protein AidB-like acyl-CoA dehydrogenase
MFGDVSDYFAVMAKHNESLKMILLSKDTEGLVIKETTSLDQTRPMCEISLSDIKIQENDIMIEPTDTADVWEKVKNISLSFLAMEQVGGSQACLDMSTTYAKERIQFRKTHRIVSSNPTYMCKYVTSVGKLLNPLHTVQ